MAQNIIFASPCRWLAALQKTSVWFKFTKNERRAMTESEGQSQTDASDEFVCPDCRKRVEEADDFCPHCGVIFSKGIVCDKHHRIEASGVCVVCGVPCCDECGGAMNGLFLCIRHSSYEIFQGMVKVYGTHDDADAEIAKARLNDAGLHATLFYLKRFGRKSRVGYEVFEEGKTFNTSEIKVMVPCQEVIEAENVLKAPCEPT